MKLNYNVKNRFLQSAELCRKKTFALINKLTKSK